MSSLPLQVSVAAAAAGFACTTIVAEYLIGMISKRKEQRKVSETTLQIERLDDKVNKLMEKVTLLDKKLEKNLEKKN
ncbi:hypothetical protein ACHQM5_012275 [Ranunculus cassubicifolius]